MGLRIAGFGGGAVLEGSADTQRTDEVQVADSVDITGRGTLVCTSDAQDYVQMVDTLIDNQGFSRCYHLFQFDTFNSARIGMVGEAITGGNLRYWLGAIAREGQATPAAGQQQLGAVVPMQEGCVVTAAPFQGVFHINVVGGTGANINPNIHLVNLGAREGFPAYQGASTSFGLWVIAIYPPATGFNAYQISLFDALGTGDQGEIHAGTFPDYTPAPGPATHGKQLWFRGIETYNNHAWGWGYDSADVTNADGPNRVMFSNLGNPLKWGNDNIGTVGTDRAFTDSDAIVLGDQGELIRGAIKMFGKLYFGTNRGLHFISGYGRDTFLTDGATPVMRSFNVVGPHAMVEGPDKKLYGVSETGLWSFVEGSTPIALFQRLRDFSNRSNGWNDLIWTDISRGIAYPGRTNQDLVWTAVDWDRQQVLVGIPWCDATAGYGYGTDTVVMKYHPATNGFTRQVFVGVQYTAAGYFRASGQTRGTAMLGSGTVGSATVRRFGYKATNNATPVLPTVLPSIRFGPYAPYGADGRGPIRRLYLVLAWDSAGALPLVFTVTYKVDGSTVAANTLTIKATAPAGPADGDLWLDTSQTNTDLGNATAGTITPALGGYLLNVYRTARTAWIRIPGLGMQGARATIPIPIARRRGTRVTLDVVCTAASARFQFEGIGLDAPAGLEAA